MTTTVYLFSSPTCPHCPAAKDSLERLERNDIKKIYLEFPAHEAEIKAQEYGVQSVPTFIIQQDTKSPIGLRGSQSIDTLNKFIDKVQGKEKTKQNSPIKSFLSKIGIEIN